MKIPIPDDWNGQDWFCVKIQWPDSPLWTAILTGFLSLPSYGYFWDERHGSIIDVQAIGRLIFSKNFPYHACDGRKLPPGDDGVISELRDLFMGECSIPYGSIRWGPNGTLQYRYCGEWYDVGGTQPTEVTTPPPEGYPFDDPSVGLYPCGKAYNLATGLVEVASYAWDESDNSIPPFFIWGAESSVGFELKDTYMSELWALTLAHKGSRTIASGIVPLDRGNVLPEDMLERIACLLVGSMSSTAFEEDGDYIDSQVGKAISTIIPATSIDNIAAQAWWYVVKAAIGKAMMINLANGGATDNTKVCDCPGVIVPPGPTDPVVDGWYLSEEYSTSSTITDVADAGNVTVCDTANYHVYGLFSWCTLTYQTGPNLRWFKFGNPGGCANDVNLTWHASTAVYSTLNINCQMDDSPMTLLYDSLEASQWATGLNKQTDTLGPRSKIVDSPVAEQGEVMQLSFGGHMDTGATATATFHWRYVYNADDSSH